MSEEFSGKLNHLQRELPEGLVVDAVWLKTRGYSAQLCRKYVLNGWLERLAHGVYRKPGGKLLWEHVVISLQTLLMKPLLVGGGTALSLHGFSHYLRREEKEVHLYGLEEAPTWLNKLPLPIKFVHHNSAALFRSEPITFELASLGWNLKNDSPATVANLHSGSFRVMTWGQWEWPLTLSTPERAVLEMLDGLPGNESFDQADKIIEGLTTLSPRKLQKLLIDCRSIKVKRLFFFFADRHNHPWRKHLDKDAINFGKGKRMLVPGGRLDPTYLITVPEELYAGQ
ncbi:type IV toxin-antitoxin system AbiEi family antitoxin (plasmid) [Rhizobium sp. RCAM05350]|uniref:type IV toxin-antitoxin system AbiEi family antitoxin domain-containing protein n=1 Tax=Rhizobium sp. RCAM05350 TaxID=2895568 RepID=UPI0020767D2B|nr:type IV toxin-antitoxin system AbiEi family antitoxin domain-containing protein [Rhizobium sp. RCAM05350]URK89460.1 type IV toxin-antitoxin system AbiEi family antitoxin [Rhizobium sp. RCAM05350]